MEFIVYVILLLLIEPLLNWTTSRCWLQPTASATKRGQSRNHGIHYLQLIGKIYFERPESGNPCWHCCYNATIHHPQHRHSRRCPCNASLYKRSSRHPCWLNNPYLRQLAGSRSIRRSTKAEYKLVAIQCNFSYVVSFIINAPRDSPDVCPELSTLLAWRWPLWQHSRA